MLVHLQEHNLYAEITGFREVRIGDTMEITDAKRYVGKGDTAVQFLSAELVATWEHLYFALLNAVIGFGSSYAISKNLGVEVMLYASAQRQIKKAIDLIGVKRGCMNLAVVIVGSNEGSVKASLSAIIERVGKKPDETVLELSKSKIEKIRRVFAISKTEIEATSSDSAKQALVNLIIERMALLPTMI